MAIGVVMAASMASSIVWSASFWVTFIKAAAPNKSWVLIWAVRPNGKVGVIETTFMNSVRPCDQ
jgi:hypothetical protein